MGVNKVKVLGKGFVFFFYIIDGGFIVGCVVIDDVMLV